MSFSGKASNEEERGIIAGGIYALGHSDQELRRLESQSHFFRHLTENFFKRAGITQGMRVVDIGCGAGDVSFLVASMVGQEGSVVGIDKGKEAIALAQERAAAAGLTNVTFFQAEAEDIVLAKPVDAVVGRLMLMYLPDPAAFLRRIASRVNSGGVIAFQEIDTLGFRSKPQLTLLNECVCWITETLRSSGAHIQMGLDLFRTFLDAGLGVPQMMMEARVEGGPNSEVYEYMAQLVRSLLPMIEKCGLSDATYVDIDTLAERLRHEAVANESVILMPPLIGAWARKGNF